MIISVNETTHRPSRSFDRLDVHRVHAETDNNGHKHSGKDTSDKLCSGRIKSYTCGCAYIRWFTSYAVSESMFNGFTCVGIVNAFDVGNYTHIGYAIYWMIIVCVISLMWMINYYNDSAMVIGNNWPFLSTCDQERNYFTDPMEFLMIHDTTYMVSLRVTYPKKYRLDFYLITYVLREIHLLYRKCLLLASYGIKRENILSRLWAESINLRYRYRAPNALSYRPDLG